MKKKYFIFHLEKRIKTQKKKKNCEKTAKRRKTAKIAEKHEKKILKIIVARFARNITKK